MHTQLPSYLFLNPTIPACYSMTLQCTVTHKHNINKHTLNIPKDTKTITNVGCTKYITKIYYFALRELGESFLVLTKLKLSDFSDV